MRMMTMDVVPHASLDKSSFGGKVRLMSGEPIACPLAASVGGSLVATGDNGESHCFVQVGVRIKGGRSRKVRQVAWVRVGEHSAMAQFWLPLRAEGDDGVQWGFPPEGEWDGIWLTPSGPLGTLRGIASPAAQAIAGHARKLGAENIRGPHTEWLTRLFMAAMSELRTLSDARGERAAYAKAEAEQEV